MKSKRSKMVSVGAVVGLAMTAAACGGGDDSADGLTTLNVTVGGNVENYTALYVADALGEFEKEGIEIDIQVVPTADALALLGTGRLDVTAATYTASTLNAINSGLDLKFVAPTHFGPGDNKDGLYVDKKVAGAGPAAMKGEKYIDAIGPGGPSIAVLGDYLEKGDLGIKDVPIERVDTDSLATAFQNGQMAATFLPSPLWTSVDPADATLVGQWPKGYPGAFYTFGPNLLEKDRATGEAFVRAIKTTVEEHLTGDYKQNDEVVEAIASAIGVPVATIKDTPALEFDPKLAFDQAYLERVQSLWNELGVLEFEDPIPASDMVDLTFISKAADE